MNIKFLNCFHYKHFRYRQKTSIIHVAFYYIFADNGTNINQKYLSVVEFAKKLKISERTVRNYCAVGKLKEAFLTGKTWNIPEDAVIPRKGNKNAGNTRVSS